MMNIKSIHSFYDSIDIKRLFKSFLGYSIVFSSSFLKLPELFLIIKHESGNGMSIITLCLEIFVNTFSLSYHRQKKFPFSTFGECAFILFQNLVMLILISYYSKKRNQKLRKRFLFSIFLIFGIFFFILGNEFQIIPFSLINFLYKLCFPLSMIRKFPQIYLTFRIRYRGVLSPITTMFVLLGSIGRLYTTIIQLHDFQVIIFNISSCILNGILFIQTIIYPKTRKHDEMLPTALEI